MKKNVEKFKKENPYNVSTPNDNKKIKKIN